MLVTPNQVRTRIDHLRLSLDGYNRQLQRLDLSDERRSRHEAEVRIFAEEISTLRKLLEVMRVEPDPEKVEIIARDRLAEVRENLARDPLLEELDSAAKENSSGEARALLWALGEDTFSAGMRAAEADRAERGASGAVQALPMILRSGLSTGADANARASAAYELGVLHVVEAIPDLAAVLGEEGPVAEMALLALSRFSDNELFDAGLSTEIVGAAQRARSVG
jgi:hypothetical protein